MNEHIKQIPFSEEEFYSEAGLFIADKLTKELLDKGIITPLQYKEITALNRKSFSVITVDLLPE